MTVAAEAAEFALWAHNGQKRKYRGEPYIVHCAEVAALVAGVGCSEEAVAAAWLHDTLEDQPIKVSEGLLRHLFGANVTRLVVELTEDPDMGLNRRQRKEIERDRLRSVSTEAKTIKIADLISNTRSIVADDPGFAKTYMEEKRLLLPYLWAGNQELFLEADLQIANYFNTDPTRIIGHG